MNDVLKPVSPFELNRYLGKWFEIARLPTWFEKDLSNVTANYSIANDGKVRVENCGVKRGKLKTAIGKAKLAKDPTVAHLKVSFFGPFYADYKIIVLDTVGYQYAMVASSYKYLWVLNREPTMDKAILDRLLVEAQKPGFDTNQLIYASTEVATLAHSTEPKI